VYTIIIDYFSLISHHNLIYADYVSHLFSSIGSVCQLIAAGVDVNMLDTGHSKNTPLHWAASYGSKDVIQCLVSEYGTVCVNTVYVKAVEFTCQERKCLYIIVCILWSRPKNWDIDIVMSGK